MGAVPAGWEYYLFLQMKKSLKGIEKIAKASLLISGLDEYSHLQVSYSSKIQETQTPTVFIFLCLVSKT